jgi:Flp pilus assembly pilin Flp
MKPGDERLTGQKRGRQIRKRISTRISSITARTAIRRFRRALGRQGAQGMVEYVFILTLIALVVIVMLITTGGQIRSMYSDITYTLHTQAGL